MSSQTEVVSLISKELTAFEEQIAKQPKGDLKTQLMKLQVSDINLCCFLNPYLLFVLTTYRLSGFDTFLQIIFE